MRRAIGSGLLSLIPAVLLSACGAKQPVAGEEAETVMADAVVEIPQTLQWASAYCGQTQIDVQDLAVAADGRIALLGALQGGVRDEERTLFVPRFEPVSSPDADVMTFYFATVGADGEHQSIFVPRGHTKTAKAHSVQSAGDGNWLVGGEYADALRLRDESVRPELSHVRGQDLFMLTFNDEGQPIGDVHAGGRGDESVQAVTVTPDGSTYMVGSYHQSVNFHRRARLSTKRGGNLYLAKLGDDGQVDWVRHLFGSSNEITNVRVKPTSDGDLIVVGRFAEELSFGEGSSAIELESRGEGDVFVSRVDASGELRWLEQAGGEGDETPLSLNLDADDEITVIARAGRTIQVGRERDEESVNGGDKASFVIAHYAGDDGSLHDARRLGRGRSLSYASGTGLPDGGSVVVGGFEGELALRGDDLGLNASPEGSIFIARLFSDDRIGRVETTEGGGGAIATHVRVHPQGGIVVAGTFSEPLTLAPGAPGQTELRCAGRPGVFIAHYTLP